MDKISDLQFSLEERPGLHRELTVTVPASPIEREVQKRLQKLASTTRMNGFRPGKVPFKVVTTRFGDGVRQEVISETMQTSFYQAVSEQKLQPAGLPKIEILQNEKDEELRYKANFEIYPKFELEDLGEVALKKEVVEITDEDVDKMIDTLRKQRAQWQAVDREAIDGDKVIADLTGTVEGKDFPGGSAEKAEFIIGSQRMLDGFEDQLKGVKPDDEKDITATLPDSFPDPEFASKPALFRVKVLGVEEPQLPELNEEFIKQFGVEDGSLDGLRKEVRNNMQRELDVRLGKLLKNRALQILQEQNDIPLPEVMVEAELHNLMHRGKEHEHQHAHDHDHSDATPEQRAEAEKRVALGILLAEIIQKENISPDAEQVRAEIEKIAAPFEDKQMVINWYYGDENRLSDIRNMVLENQVVDWIMDRLKVEEISATFDEIMNPEG